jgi:DNA-binding winged helix-turn-helix (wHTH) protein/tetratricopeptide (TPR) repeat protein
MDGEFRVGTWLVQPSLDLISRNGTTIHLEPKVMEVLVCLAQHAGEPVSKEELLQTIWPGTYVSDDVLKRCIFELRRVFEDDVREPRTIATIPKRGYRLIAPVSRNGEDGSSPPATNADVERSIPIRKLVLALAAGLVVAAIAGGFLWRSRQLHRLAEKDVVVLGGFENSTGDQVFDGTLRQGLAVQLEQSPFLKLLSEDETRQTLAMMGQASNARLTREIGREVCQRTNSSAALDGSIALVGSRYDVILRAVDCASGDLLASSEAQANSKSDVLDALGSAASDMRRRLGESLGSVQKNSTPIAQATTPSLEALQAYSLGLQTIKDSGDFAAALPSFERATELDPNFAMAYLSLGDAYSVLGNATASAKYLQKAFDLRDSVSEHERVLIEGDFYLYVKGDLVRARHAFELRAKMNPDSHYAHNVLAMCSIMVGEYGTALNEYKEALRLAPRNSILHRHLVFTYLLLGRTDEAAATAKRAQTSRLDKDLAPALYLLAFYRGDAAEMDRQTAMGDGKEGTEDLLAALQADTAAYFGHLAKARELSVEAAEFAERAGQKETAAGYHSVSALREALYGNSRRARQEVAAAERLSHGRDVDYAVALALAWIGDSNRALTRTNDLARRFPDDTVIQSNYVPTTRGMIAVRRFNPRQALDVLTASGPYELGLPAYSFYNWPNLYPVYVRGEAYLAAKQADEAVAEFRKILDHRSIVLNEPIGALARLQLGRAYALQGDSVKARSAYQEFLTLWKDADPDIPILRHAREEYEKLR